MDCGLSEPLQNRLCFNGHRGFESPPLRQSRRPPPPHVGGYPAEHPLATGLFCEILTIIEGLTARAGFGIGYWSGERRRTAIVVATNHGR